MVNVAVDSSLLIEEVRLGSVFWKNLKSRARNNEIRLISSVVVLTELWASTSMNNKKDFIDMEKIIEIISFVDLNQKLSKMAGEISRNYEIKGFDAIIAATAMECGAELATLNTKHFKNIKGLKLCNENL